MKNKFKFFTFVFLIVFMLTSFSIQIKNINSISKENTSKLTKMISLKKIPPLIGIWCDEEGNPIFKITKDSIFYIDEFKSYLYKTKKDSMIIFYDTWVSYGTFQIIGTKLILKDDENETESKFKKCN